MSEICDTIDKMELEQDMTIVWEGDFNLFFDSFLDADGGKPQLKIKGMLGMLGGGENLCGWLFMMELLPLGYHCMRT